ncbi:MAG TPA: ABC transporter permease, partial [Polymorphobacter sp.]|nr:ABC transporter permease [Polymorphobacter sp.]
MLKNYMTVAFRALANNRAFALINILGLAIGMAACLLLLLFVRYETTYDQWLPGHENAYQVQTVHNDPANGRVNAQQASAYVVGRTLAKDFPEVTKVAYAGLARPVVVQDGVASTAQLMMADPEILQILQLPFVRGDARTALRDPHSIVMTQSEAAKRFPGREAIGQQLTITLNGRTADYRVTGVLRDIPRNSHLKLSMMVPFNRLSYNDQPAFYTNFGWNSGYNYIQLKPGVTPADLASRWAAWEKRNIAPENVGGIMVSQGDVTDWVLTPVTGVHLGKAVDSGMTPSNDTKSIATFALIALLILAMACINFTNLSTARAGHRAREVALRKVMGASRRQLVTQFLGESLVVAGLAMIVALAIVELVLPRLSDFLGVDLALHYFGADGVLLPVLALTVFVGLAAGAYPALVLSGFDPAPVLKSNRSGTETGGSRLFGVGGLRSALVVMQFAVSSALTICTAVVTAQTFYARSADTGYSRDGLLQVTGIGRKQIAGVSDNIVDAIARVDGVKAVGRTTIGVSTDSTINTLVRIDSNPQPVELGNYNIDTGFFAAMGIKPLAGRGFDRANPHDDSQIPA